MANQHNYSFQTGYSARGRSSHPGQPRPPHTRSPRTSETKNQGQALFVFAVATACLCFASAVGFFLLRRFGLDALLGFDVEALIMTAIGAGIMAAALRHLRHANRPGGFSKLAQETIATVFFLGVGSNLAMDMSQVALKQGMLATLIAALAIILGGFLVNKAYP